MGQPQVTNDIPLLGGVETVSSEEGTPTDGTTLVSSLCQSPKGCVPEVLGKTLESDLTTQ